VKSSSPAQAASAQSGASSVPSRASGTNSRVTTGTATRLASTPTSEIWPKNNSASGASPRVTTACVRSSSRTGCTRSPPCCISSATATKLSQKPGCTVAQGSASAIGKAQASRASGQGQSRPLLCSSATNASSATVRCAGTPQPASSA
jgi:hypothetical protein